MCRPEYDRYGVRVSRSHLVLLGAGASLAAFPEGDKNGLKLPLMHNMIETVTGLSEYLSSQEITISSSDFEEFYSSLCKDGKNTYIRQAIDSLIYDYFSKLRLPREPTLYDHLVLSLTGRDAIATFNWDPFLWQAISRSQRRVGRLNTPSPIFLHGNTAIGFCLQHEKVQVLQRNRLCPKCGMPSENSRLLYPVAQKNYNSDSFIQSGWHDIKLYLEHSYMFTIFGYSAPTSDVEAIDLLSEAWGDKYQRSLEQIEIIDILEEDTLNDRWDRFIHTHHYDTHKDFYSSMIGKCSRRSTDACFGANIDCIFWEEYPIPQNASWEELDDWLEPYIKTEEDYNLRK